MPCPSPSSRHLPYKNNWGEHDCACTYVLYGLQRSAHLKGLSPQWKTGEDTHSKLDRRLWSNLQYGGQVALEQAPYTAILPHIVSAPCTEHKRHSRPPPHQLPNSRIWIARQKTTDSGTSLLKVSRCGCDYSTSFIQHHKGMAWQCNWLIHMARAEQHL